MGGRYRNGIDTELSSDVASSLAKKVRQRDLKKITIIQGKSELYHQFSKNLAISVLTGGVTSIILIQSPKSIWTDVTVPIS